MGKEECVAWYSLDQSDNARERYWLYLIAALQSVHGSLGKGTMEILQTTVRSSDTLEHSESFLSPLLNDLFLLKTPLFLVLDDYHLIHDLAIHRDMEFFIDNIPPSVHLIVTTRSEPPWPLPRWRARRQMHEIRQKDLAFSQEETAHLFGEIEGLHLNAEEIETLHNKTEGWITGLQLAIISLTNHSDTAGFINNFAGSHRHIFHFLSQEVLSGQSEARQEFLLKTSILKHFCPSLCNAVTGRDDSDELLLALERDNLFVIPLDTEGQWYTYHALFSDLLFHQLRKKEAHSIPLLHDRAAGWFLEQEAPEEALRHVLQGNDLQQGAHILQEHLETMMNREGPGLINECLHTFPGDLLARYPRLLIHKSWLHLIHKGKDEAKKYIDLAEKAGEQPTEYQDEMMGMLEVVKAYYHIYTHNFPAALRSAEKGLHLLPPHNIYWRTKVSIISGDARLFSGNPKDAYSFYKEAYKNNGLYGNVYLTLSTGFKLATSLYYMGRLTEARSLTRSLLDIKRKKGFTGVPRTGLLWVLLGELHREAGHLGEASQLVEKGITISDTEKPSLGWNLLFAITLSCSKKDYTKALETVKAMEDLHAQVQLPRFILIPKIALQARILSMMGKTEEARQCLTREKITVQGTVQGGQERLYLSLISLLIKEDHQQFTHEQIQRLFREIETQARKGNNTGVLIETLLLKSMYHDWKGDKDSGEKHCKEALHLGFTRGYRQTFLDWKEDLKDVLHRILPALQHSSGQEEQDFPAYILDLYGKDSSHQGRQHPISTSQNLIEDLSVREKEILLYMAQGLTNSDIAQKLYLSTGTVKWHASNMYGKLGVRNRTHAILRARELNLIP